MSFKIYRSNKTYNFSAKCVDDKQVHIVISSNKECKDCLKFFADGYKALLSFIREHNISILHERIFGGNSYYRAVKDIRSEVLNDYKLENLPFTYIEGNPYWGEGIAGLNIYGVILDKKSSLQTVKCDSKDYGRIWQCDNEQYIVLHNLVCKPSVTESKYEEFIGLFDCAQKILASKGFEFKNVFRTWIYFDELLRDYNEFNKARTDYFIKWGLLSNSRKPENYEKIYMPASTGIGCSNPCHSPAVMDVFAVKKNEKSKLTVMNETGTEQRAAFRYGSAFSRSIVLQKERHKQLYLSGTASIDQEGKTMFHGDITNQIDRTFKVIKSLIQGEQIGLEDMCESTVFLKKSQYQQEYEDYIERHRLTSLPVIITIADVCRDDLLFEMDASFGT